MNTASSAECNLAGWRRLRFGAGHRRQLDLDELEHRVYDRADVLAEALAADERAQRLEYLGTW